MMSFLVHLVGRRIRRLVEVDDSVPHVLLELALQRGAPAGDRRVVRRSALEVVVVAEQQGPLGRVEDRFGGLRPDHVLGGCLRRGAILLVHDLGLLRALLLLLDVACDVRPWTREFPLLDIHEVCGVARDTGKSAPCLIVRGVDQARYLLTEAKLCGYPARQKWRQVHLRPNSAYIPGKVAKTSDSTW